MFEICENAITPFISNDIASIRQICNRLRHIGTNLILESVYIYKLDSLASFEYLINIQPILTVKKLCVVIDNGGWFNSYHRWNEITAKMKQWLCSHKFTKFTLTVKNVDDNRNLRVIIDLINYINTESFYLRWPQYKQTKLFSELIYNIINRKKKISIFKIHLDPTSRQPNYNITYTLNNIIHTLIRFGRINKLILKYVPITDTNLLNAIKTAKYCHNIITNNSVYCLISMLNNTIELRDRYKIIQNGKFNEITF